MSLKGRRQSRPAGHQAGEEELPDGGEQAQQEGELPGLLERIRQTNGLEEFEPHLYEQPYLVLFAASGAAKQSWSDVEELPPGISLRLFPGRLCVGGRGFDALPAQAGERHAAVSRSFRRF